MPPVKLFASTMCTFNITVTVSQVLARSEVRVFQLMLVCKPGCRWARRTGNPVHPVFFTASWHGWENWILKEVIDWQASLSLPNKKFVSSFTSFFFCSPKIVNHRDWSRKANLRFSSSFPTSCNLCCLEKKRLTAWMIGTQETFYYWCDVVKWKAALSKSKPVILFSLISTA